MASRDIQLRQMGTDVEIKIDGVATLHDITDFFVDPVIALNGGSGARNGVMKIHKEYSESMTEEEKEDLVILEIKSEDVVSYPLNIKNLHELYRFLSRKLAQGDRFKGLTDHLRFLTNEFKALKAKVEVLEGV